VRIAVLTIALSFIGLLCALTVSDIVRNGFSALDVIAILIIAPFSIGVVGALRNPPRE
jgi:hypothetical protein